MFIMRIVLKLKRLQLFLYLLIFVVLLFVFFFYANMTNLTLHSLIIRKPCKCSHCVSELGVSEWFDRRYISIMYPILTKSNYTIPKGTYNWWMFRNTEWIATGEPRLSTAAIAAQLIEEPKKLQNVRNPANISILMKQLFELFPGDSLFMDQGPNRCRTCAVVGNSGNIKGSKYGPSIDSNDFVMRMNEARIAGYQADVGSKTTHHFMYPESAQNLADNVSLVLIPFKILDLQWLMSAFTTGRISRTYIPVLRKIKANKDKVLIFNPTFFKYVYDNWNEHHGRYSSTGMLVTIFALHVCDEVNVYGFGANSLGHWHHYWENNSGAGAFRVTGVHDGDFEANITKILANINKINFFKGT